MTASVSLGYDTDALRAISDRHRHRFPTAQDLVLNALREAILVGVLPPGLRLRQENLAAVFGTSRIPVREALRVLEYEALVHSEPHRGFTVTSLDAETIEEIFDLRIVLEGHAVRLAVSLLTDQDIVSLGRLYDALAGAKDGEKLIRAREAFYYRLYSITARPRLVALISRLRQEVAHSLHWLDVPDSPEHHAAFWAAIRGGEAEAAANILAVHYRRIGALLRRFLRQEKHDRRRAPEDQPDQSSKLQREDPSVRTRAKKRLLTERWKRPPDGPDRSRTRPDPRSSVP